MRGSKISADMHNYIWCPIYIPSFMTHVIGSVVSEELRWQDFGTDGQTDGRTDGQTDGQTDGVTALLDLLSPSATQVKIRIFFIHFYVRDWEMSFTQRCCVIRDIVWSRNCLKEISKFTTKIGHGYAIAVIKTPA